MLGTQTSLRNTNYSIDHKAWRHRWMLRNANRFGDYTDFTGIIPIMHGDSMWDIDMPRDGSLIPMPNMGGIENDR